MSHCSFCHSADDLSAHKEAGEGMMEVCECVEKGGIKEKGVRDEGKGGRTEGEKRPGERQPICWQHTLLK